MGTETSTPVPAAVGARLVLCAAADVAPGSALEVEAGGLTLAVFHVDRGFYVTDNHCTHGPGLLAEGYLEGCVVECDFHGGRFDITTGEALAPPCTVPVTTYPTRVEEGDVVIDAP